MLQSPHFLLIRNMLDYLVIFQTLKLCQKTFPKLSTVCDELSQASAPLPIDFNLLGLSVY